MSDIGRSMQSSCNHFVSISMYIWLLGVVLVQAKLLELRH